MFWLALPFLVSQFLVCIAIVADICSFQFKDRKKIILFFMLAAICIGLHYFLLERYTAAVLICIWITRFFVAYHSTWIYWKYIFIGLFAVTTIILFKDYYDILIFIAMSLSTVASFRKDDHSLRLFMMWGTVVTICYNFLIFSPFGVLLEAIFLWSNLTWYYRHYIKKGWIN